MPQIFPAYANTIARAALLGTAALALGGLGLLLAWPATSHVTRQDIIVDVTFPRCGGHGLRPTRPRRVVP
ncbi:hypothetical protein ACFFIC_20275, partial [Roseomonas vinacea]